MLSRRWRLRLPAQQMTTASAAQQITLTNSGDLPLTLIAAQITSGDFTVVNACGNSLNPHSTCSINVAFQPKSVGAITGVLTVSDQYRSQTIALSGTGVAPPGVSLSPVSTITFPATGVGVTAAAQTVTLTNNGGVPLLVQSIAITGDFLIVPGSNTCGSSVAVKCSMHHADCVCTDRWRAAFRNTHCHGQRRAALLRRSHSPVPALTSR